MKIDLGFDSALSASQLSAVQPASGESIQTARARTGQDTGASSTPAEAPTPPHKKSKVAATRETHQPLQQELTDCLKMRSAQHMRDATMTEMG